MPSPEPDWMRDRRERRNREIVDHVEARRALDPETGEPIKRQFLQGKLTAICLLISGLGAGASLFGFDFPSDHVNSILTWIAANYDGILFVIGQIGAAYGQIRRNLRREQQSKALLSL